MTERREQAGKRAYKRNLVGAVSALSGHRSRSRQNIAKGGLRSFEAATRGDRNAHRNSALSVIDESAQRGGGADGDAAVALFNQPPRGQPMKHGSDR